MALLKIIIMAIVYMTGGICYIYPLPAADRTVSEHLLTVEVFFRENCSECKAVKEEIIPNIQKQFVDKCLFQWRDVNDQENYLLLSAYLEFFNISNNAPVYVVVGQKDILTHTCPNKLLKG